MCAVQLRRQCESETKCRQWLMFALFILLLQLGICLDGTGAREMPVQIPMPWMEEYTIDECYDEYLLASANASNTFAFNYELCELTANETMIDLRIDEELERKQIELGRSTLCGNLELCDLFDDDLEYFACISDGGNNNLKLIAEINKNATSALTRIREDFDAVQQTLILCTIEAQSGYMSSMREAHEELRQCRDGVFT